MYKTGFPMNDKSSSIQISLKAQELEMTSSIHNSGILFSKLETDFICVCSMNVIACNLYVNMSSLPLIFVCSWVFFLRHQQQPPQSGSDLLSVQSQPVSH
uniref:Uncharacterized protein n=1 Tax=Anguilla anguilla TaxID=7936 RepID=A0A0E9WXK2_ANGAN